LKDIECNGNDGLGKPESLKGDLSGWWSRRIDDTNRLVYRIENSKIVIYMEDKLQDRIEVIHMKQL
jgi:toxin YoeB